MHSALGMGIDTAVAAAPLARDERRAHVGLAACEHGAGRAPRRGALARGGARARLARETGVSIVLLVLAASSMACGDSGVGTSTGAGGASTGTSGGGQGQGGGGGLPTDCAPTEGVAIPETCGVFVKSGATGNGSQASPFGTVVEASTSLGGAKAIYVCGGDVFAGSVQLAGGVSIFGGLDCASWEYSNSAAHPKIEGDADMPALKIAGVGDSALLSIDIESPNAVAPGASSIAVVVSETTLNVEQASISARNGAVGVIGAPQTKTTIPAAAIGKNGTDGCKGGAGVIGGGGGGGQQTCQAISVNGGLGGSGTVDPDGGNGNPGKPTPNPGGTSGIGEMTGSCTNGGDGQPGPSGSPGLGADAELGILSETGYLGPAGGAGLSPGGFAGGGAVAAAPTSASPAWEEAAPLAEAAARGAAVAIPAMAAAAAAAASVLSLSARPSASTPSALRRVQEAMAASETVDKRAWMAPMAATPETAAALAPAARAARAGEAEPAAVAVAVRASALRMSARRLSRAASTS